MLPNLHLVLLVLSLPHGGDEIKANPEDDQTLAPPRSRLLPEFDSPVPEVGLRHSGNCGFQVPRVPAGHGHRARLWLADSE